MNPVAIKRPTSLSDLCSDFWTRCYFKFVLPNIRRATVAGIKLDLSPLSPKIRNRILSFGYEESERKLCSRILRPTDSVLELGGGIGLIGLYCQKQIGIRDYVTVEANPQTVEILQRNYHLNGVTPTIWNMAVAKENGEVQLSIDGDFWDNYIASDRSREAERTVTVKSATLATLLAKAGGEVNTLIIDIEGSEKCLEFASLPDSIKNIIIEFHPHLIGQETVDQITCTLTKKGFRAVQTDGESTAFVRN
jgi:FkbM family methyltransferase